VISLIGDFGLSKNASIVLSSDSGSSAPIEIRGCANLSGELVVTLNQKPVQHEIKVRVLSFLVLSTAQSF